MDCTIVTKKRFIGLAPQSRKSRRSRRTKAEITALCNRLHSIVEENQPASIRQIFYLAETAGVVDKTEAAYKGIVCRLLAKMRRDGRLPYSWIVDSTRWQRKPDSYSGLRSALEHTAHFYRQDLWQEMDAYVEIWCEKDALSGVLYEITGKWDVPLMVSRGFASQTYLYEAAEAIKAQGKPAYLYYFGDHDPSGVHIDRTIERELRRLAPDAEIHFQRVGVTEKQIREMKLPTRPTKKSDSRCKTFKGRSVEVDSIPPATLRMIAERCIVRHINADRLKRLRIVESAEREVLERVASAGFTRLQDFAYKLASEGDEGVSQ